MKYLSLCLAAATLMTGCAAYVPTPEEAARLLEEKRNPCGPSKLGPDVEVWCRSSGDPLPALPNRMGRGYSTVGE